MRPQPCVAGIDGGGTKSHLLLYNAQMEKIGEVFSGTTNLCAAEESVVEDNLRRLFALAEDTAMGGLDIRAVALGTAGVSRSDATDLLTQMIKRITGCSAVTVVGDMVLPIYAYAPDAHGVNLIAGTGSVCYGRSADGRTARSGGWGHLFSDEGGAYWLACRGLDACLRAYDGRAEQTALTPLLLTYFSCASPPELISVLYGSPHNKSFIAGAAVCVGEAAQQGDGTAAAILHEAANELFLMVKATVNAITTPAAEAAPETIILSGSVLLKNNIIRDALCEQLTGYYPAARIILAEAAAGAAAETAAETAATAGDKHAVNAAWGAVCIAARSIGWKA